MLEPKGLTGGREDAGAKALRVVREDAPDDAVALKPRDRATDERGHMLATLARQNLGIGQARVIVDADMHELPADAALARARIAVDAMAGGREAPQALRVDVHEVAGPRPFITPNDRRGAERGQAREAELAQRAGDRRCPVCRDVRRLAKVGAAATTASQIDRLR
jgi:hypothetical protein